jgi:hypothetical protein
MENVGDVCTLRAFSSETETASVEDLCIEFILPSTS